MVGLRTVLPDPPAELECDGYQHPRSAASADALPRVDGVTRDAAERAVASLPGALLARWDRYVYEVVDGEVAVEPISGFHAVVVSAAAACTATPQFYEGVPVTYVRGPGEMSFLAELGAATASIDDVEQLCSAAGAVAEQRARDDLTGDAVHALQDALPEPWATDVALFHFPLGRSFLPGTDTAGIRAQLAGDRLAALFKRACGGG